MKKFLAASLLALSTLAYAGDAAKLTHLGFSQDGKSYAFMQSGVQDGSGFSYAEIRILDVVNNKYIGDVFEAQQTDEEEEIPVAQIEAKAIAKASAKLKELGISSENPGEVLVNRKITDISTRSLPEATFSNGLSIAGFHAPHYQVKLTQKKAKSGSETACSSDYETKKLKVELMTIENKKVKVLQEDKRVPASRGCAHNYEIEDVIVHSNGEYLRTDSKVVVLLRVYMIGFEGEDVRYMAVSGTLE